jgi:hypothetical protein
MVALASRLERLERAMLRHEQEAAEREGLDPAWIAQEVMACKADPVHFVDTYCKVQSDEGKGLVPFRLYDYQKEVLRAFEEHREVIVLKARQLGISELAAAYAVWMANFRPLNTIIVLSQGEVEAKEFTNKARVCWSHLPDWLRVSDRDPSKTSSLELVNGSRILPKPATGKAGRSLTAQLLILDEWAHQEAQREIFTAASPVARSAGNKIIGISTANGAGNHFHEQWLLAQESLGMFPLFIGWDARPGRDEQWLAHATAGYEPWQRHQEFPSRAEEAFVLSGRCRFDTEALDAILAGCREPVATELGGGLRIWELPRQSGRYVAGADTAEGLAKGDWCAAVVLDWESGLEVAELHGKWPPEVFAEHLSHLCRWYNNAFLGVEKNNHGHAVLLALTTLHDYPNLYMHTNYDATGNASPRVGWSTDSRSKPIMIDALAQTIRERRPWRNAGFVSECKTYVVKDNGDTGASGNLHDDRVVAYAIAEMLRRHAPPTQEVVWLAEELGLEQLTIDPRY